MRDSILDAESHPLVHDSEECGFVLSSHVVLFLIQTHEPPGFGESYTEDLPTFSLSPQEYITNVRVDSNINYF